MFNCESAMAMDGPSNRRMGFGFQQARAAGAPYTRPRTAGQMDFALKEKAAEKEIRALVEMNPSLGPTVRQFIKEHTGGGPDWWPVQDILFVLKCIIASESKTGFTIMGADGKSYKSDKVHCIYTDGVSIIHEGRPFMLHKHYIASIVVNKPDEE